MTPVSGRVPVAGETWGWAVRACLGKPWNAHALKIRNQLHCIIILYYTILTYIHYIYICIYTILRLCMEIYHSLNRPVCPNLGWRKSNLKPCDKWCDAAVFLISHHGRWSSFLVSDSDIPVHHRLQNKAAIACYCYFFQNWLNQKNTQESSIIIHVWWYTPFKYVYSKVSSNESTTILRVYSKVIGCLIGYYLSPPCMRKPTITRLDASLFWQGYLRSVTYALRFEQFNHGILAGAVHHLPILYRWAPDMMKSNWRYFFH